jgi:epidermal growth factor receptor substrate 15
MKLVLFISALLFSFFGVTQNLTYRVNGRISNTDTKKMEAGVTVSFLSNGKVLASVVSSSNGKYDLRAEGLMGGNFQVTYSKPGFITKKVGFNGAKMTEEDIPAGIEFPLPTLDMELFAERPNADFSFLNSEPVALFFWDETQLILSYDKDASVKIKKKIEDLLASTVPASTPDPSEAKYQAAIKEGEALFVQKKYELAVVKYEEANVLKPKETLPISKINEIDKLLKAQKNEQLAGQQLETEYKNLITAADNLRDQKKYSEAIIKYNEAIKKKDESYPKNEVTKLNTLIADQKAKDLQFEALKKEGLSLSDSKKWNDAKTKLEAAIIIKPDPTITSKIKEIDSEIAKENANKEKNDKYNSAIKSGEELLIAGKLLEAKAKYTEATLIEPNQPLPKQKIAEITTLIANQAAKEAANSEAKAKIEKLISEGNALFSKNDLIASKLKFEEVLKEDTGNSIALSKLKEINSKLEAEKGQALKDSEFETLKKEGLLLASSKKYPEAKVKLQQALVIKPDAIVSQKIIEIDNALKENQTHLALEEEFKKIMSEATNLENSKNYDGAIAKYKEALIKKPSEIVPKTKIAELEKIKTALAKEEANKGQAQKDAEFETLKKEGMALASSKKYPEAKLKLEQAILVRPDVLISQKIVEIDKAIKDSESQANLEEEFKKIMVEAASLEVDKNYDGAISKYKLALVKKPSEVLPKSKIADLEKLKKALENQNVAESQKHVIYDQHISSGNKNVLEKKYDLALVEYQNALLSKPNDNVAQNKIAEVKQILDDLNKAKNETDNVKKNIDKLFTDADHLFKQEKYLDAKLIYEKILSIESENKKALQQIADCDRLEKAKSLIQGDSEYKKLVSAADKKFNEKNYLKAKEYYERAVVIRNTDPYPKQKIAEIDGILNPKPVVATIATKTEVNLDKLEPLGIPYSKSIIDAKEELKKAEIARLNTRNNELKSGTLNVNDKALELGNEKHQEQLQTTKNVNFVNQEIEKSNDDKNISHQDVIELNKKISKEQSDFNDNSNILEINDHFQIQDKMDLIVQDNTAFSDDKNLLYVVKGDVLKKHNTEYSVQVTSNSEKYDEKNITSKKEIIDVEQVIFENQKDNKESRVLAEERIEASVKKTIEKSDDLNNTETNEILNVKNQLTSSEKLMSEKNETDLKNANDISVDIYEVKNKVQKSVDNSVEHKTEESNIVTNKIVDINKKNAEENVINEDNLKNSNEKLKESNKELFDNTNDEYNNEMIKYLASKNNIKGKTDKINETNIASNDKLIEHNSTIKGMTTSISEENGKQNNEQTDKHLTAQQSIHDKKEDIGIEKPVVVNSLGKEYPEGVSQESFTQNDENGLMKAVITRRIVVVSGKGDVYVRTQTLSTITYSKNGSPSSERVWQKETQGPSLEKHF